jgi:DNA-binding NtrC family response regulator
MAKILVVDDEQSVVWALERFLKSLGHETLSAATAEDGIELARRHAPDLIFLDVKLPGRDGLSALRELQGRRVVILTAHGTLDTAVQALKLGAVEYLSKPVDLARARQLLDDLLRQAPESAEVQTLRGEKLGSLVGKTAAMQRIFRAIATVCESDATVLVTGESGTGKEVVARAIHYHSKRANGPFEPINCSAIPETLLESELFGHEKG